MVILGIETSCDETSVAVLLEEKVSVNLISSQYFHELYGGVVPELSSRAHLQTLIPLIKKALQKTSISINDVDIIAATAGPGLIGALLVGLNVAKGISYSSGKVFIPVNHIEGHIFSGFLMEEKPSFPFLCLVVSGGHTLLLLVEDELRIKRLGVTIDDSAGEAFDKTAKMLGLGYPGGPKIQYYAGMGNRTKINFPVARLNDKYNFSFSGLKTSVLRYLQKNYADSEIPKSDIADIAAAFQEAVIKALTANVRKALTDYKVESISMVGGVAANVSLREKMQSIANQHKIKLIIPANEYCGDNAAMIACRALQLYKRGIKYSLNYNAFPALSEKVFIH